MPNFVTPNQDELAVAEKEQLRPSDLDNGAVFAQGEWIGIVELQGTRTQKYAPGFGVSDRQYAEGWADFDLQDSGANAVSGVLRWALYASSAKERRLNVSSHFSPASLRSAVSANLTEKIVMAQRSPFTGQDRVLVLECKVDNSTNEGNNPDTGNSAANEGIPYARVEQ